MTSDQEVTLCAQIAREAHHLQVRWGGADFFTEHVEKIALAARERYGVAEAAAAYLHDVFEDTSVRPDDVIGRGVSGETVRRAIALTHKEGETYRRYIERLRDCGDRVVIRVKLLDLQNNRYAPLPPSVTGSDARMLTHEQRMDKYDLAIMVLTEALAKFPPTS